MSDELDEKRREKIESFKLEFNDDFEDEFENTNNISADSADTVEEAKDFSIDLQSGREIESDTDDYISNDLSSYSDKPPEPARQLNKRELRAAKRLDKKRRKLKAKKNRVIFRTVWLTMIVFVSIMIGQYVMVGVNDMLAVGREEEKTVEINIPENATLDQVTDILSEKGLITNKSFFKLYATITKSAAGFEKGTFEVQTNKDYEALINKLQTVENRTDVVSIRFREGISILEMADLLEKNKVCTADQFLEKCNSDEFDDEFEFLKDINNESERYYKLEGYLFPDTYDFYVGENPVSVVYKFLNNYNDKLYHTKIRFVQGEKKSTVAKRAEKLGMSMEEVITLASLIQAEAANEDDMYVISSILHNRLDTIPNDGENKFGEGGFKKLQLDSTVYYPYKTQNQVPAPLRKNYVSRYDTYKIDGLTAGPICNPGLDAIEAAVNPSDTNYYYFCHKAADGEQGAIPYYAKSEEEHLANRKKAGLL